MKSDHGRWPCPMVQLRWFGFLRNQFMRPLGPSLGVNPMWTKRNDHAPKSECADLFFIYAQKINFEEEEEEDCFSNK